MSETKDNYKLVKNALDLSGLKDALPEFEREKLDDEKLCLSMRGGEVEEGVLDAALPKASDQRKFRSALSKAAADAAAAPASASTLATPAEAICSACLFAERRAASRPSQHNFPEHGKRPPRPRYSRDHHHSLLTIGDRRKEAHLVKPTECSSCKPVLCHRCAHEEDSDSSSSSTDSSDSD